MALKPPCHEHPKQISGTPFARLNQERAAHRLRALEGILMQRVSTTYRLDRTMMAGALRHGQTRLSRPSDTWRFPHLVTWLTVPIARQAHVAMVARRFLARVLVFRSCRLHAFHVSQSHADVLLDNRPDDAIVLAHDLLDCLRTTVQAATCGHREILITPDLPRSQAIDDFIERFQPTQEWGWWPRQLPRRPLQTVSNLDEGTTCEAVA